jgi:hypothetical protein
MCPSTTRDPPALPGRQQVPEGRPKLARTLQRCDRRPVFSIGFIVADNIRPKTLFTMELKGWNEVRRGSGGGLTRRKQGAPKKTSGRSFFSEAPRCAPLRLALRKHPHCHSQVTENTALRTAPPGRNCLPAKKDLLSPAVLARALPNALWKSFKSRSGSRF